MARKFLHLLYFTICTNFVLANSDVSQNFTEVGSQRVLSRKKRYLIFPQGSNVQLVYCLTIGAYGRDGDLVVGLTAAMAWELPSTVDHKTLNLLSRRSRSVIYPKIEALLKSAGLDGRSCVLKALCEAGKRDMSEVGKGTLVQEILHAVFTLPRDGRKFESTEHQIYDYVHQMTDDCEEAFPTCQHSIYDVQY